MTSEKNSWAGLTLSLPIPLRLYTLPYWSSRPFLIFGILALWLSGLGARASECQKIKIIGLDQYGVEPSEQQQFGTAGVERVNLPHIPPPVMPNNEWS